MIMKYRSEFDIKADLIRTAMNSTKPLTQYRLAVITGVYYITIRPYITALIVEGLLTVTNNSLYVPTETGIRFELIFDKLRQMTTGLFPSTSNW